MSTRITDDIIRSLSTPQSFQRGRSLHLSEAVFDTVRQGNILLGKCEGSSAPFYFLRVELDEAGVRDSECSCPYDFGGLCKHLIAFLLTFVHQPDAFTERKRIPDLLKDLDREALVTLLTNLVAGAPDLYDQVELAAMTAEGLKKAKDSPPRSKRKTTVSEQAYIFTN